MNSAWKERTKEWKKQNSNNNGHNNNSTHTKKETKLRKKKNNGQATQRNHIKWYIRIKNEKVLVCVQYLVCELTDCMVEQSYLSSSSFHHRQQFIHTFTHSLCIFRNSNHFHPCYNRIPFASITIVFCLFLVRYTFFVVILVVVVLLRVYLIGWVCVCVFYISIDMYLVFHFVILFRLHGTIDNNKRGKEKKSLGLSIFIGLSFCCSCSCYRCLLLLLFKHDTDATNNVWIEWVLSLANVMKATATMKKVTKLKYRHTHSQIEW